MRYLYKQAIFVVMICIIFLVSTNQTYASHAMGSDITYTYLGGNQYQITFSFYRDCSGIPVSASTDDITVTNTCGFPTQNLNLTLSPTGPTQITPICPTALSTCNGGAYTGIQEYIYTGIVTLPGQCANWTIYHSESARNGAITNLAPGGSGDLFVYSTINNLNGISNTSPIFTNRPVPFACAGQRFCFNHGAYDAEGDSLSYQLITPRTGPNASDTVTYDVGFSATQPLTSTPPMTFNTATGDFCMNPSIAEVTILAVLVNEWRNGVLIGRVERDIQVTVLACNNFIPSLTGINGSPITTATVCAGNQLCFWMRTVDIDSGDSTFISWDNSIPGATFTTFGTKRDSAVFCWTPTAANISNTPYCFTATVQDNHCPYLGVQVYSYCITVIGVNPNAGLDQVVACGASTNLNGSATGGNGPYTYLWLPDSVFNQNLNGVGVGQYVLQVTSGGCKNWDTVQVFPGAGVPAANFSFTNNCSGSPIQFTDQSNVVGSTISTWSWDFGDATGSNSQNPTHQYPGNGIYNVTLTVSTPTNCVTSITQQISININIPTAQFAANNVCDGFAMNFNDQSLGGSLTNWSWNFNDTASGTNTSTSQNPSHTFTTPGLYQVTLTVTNTDGCQNQIVKSATVHPNPVIFVADAGMCAGTQTTLNGPAGYSGYSWSNAQNTQSITVNPASNSPYTLTVTDANGCIGSFTANVIVDPVPIPDAGVPQTICEGTNAYLAGIGGNTYTWNPGNLTGQNISVSPASTTVYTLTVSSNAGCSATDLVTVTVNPMPTADAGDDLNICKGESIIVNSVASAGNLLWTPGNYNTASINVTPAVTTTYYLTVSDAIGCSGTDTITIIVNPLPTASSINSSPVCENNAISFTDASVIPTGNIAFWSWSFGDGQVSNLQNPSVTYTSSGNFNVKLLVTSNAGCKDSVVKLAVVNPLPVANAGSNSSICPGFNGTLTGAGGVSYLWNPGGLITSSITLSPAATTSYTLTVTDANGCTNTDAADILVNPVPVANAGSDKSICQGQSTTFTASGGDFYLWTPGNINTQNYNLTPASSGTYTVLVTNIYGCESTDQVDVSVNPIPVAALISSGAICEKNPVHFTDQSNVNSGSIIAWNWNFNNGMSSIIQNPTVPFNSPGTFNVSLIVYSNNGCSDTANLSQTIWARPAAAFIHTNVCFGNPISFTNTSTISDASALNYSWNLGDNTLSNNVNLTHQYSSYGAYPTTLLVTSVNGCVDSVAGLVNVYSLPAASFSVDYSCEDDPAIFVDKSTIPQGLISTWQWTFGDNGSSFLQHAEHTYADAGYYDIHLLISSDHGCKDSTDGIIRVVPKPIVDFTTYNACLGYNVNLTDNSQPVTGSIVQYSWNFGDGILSSSQNPVHMYTSPGWYQVSLTATSDSGCSTILVRPNAINIYAPPVPQFINNSSEANDIYPLVNFINHTPTAEFYYWNFGDGDTSTALSPTHLYGDIGFYDVQLIAMDLNGCIDSTVVRIEIKPTSNVYIPNAFTPNGDTRNDYFQVYSYNVVTMEVQIYDRWGLKIIEWNSPKGSWDGIVNGSPAQADTYVFRVSTVDVNAKREVFVGHVSLVR